MDHSHWCVSQAHDFKDPTARRLFAIFPFQLTNIVAQYTMREHNMILISANFLDEIPACGEQEVGIKQEGAIGVAPPSGSALFSDSNFQKAVQT